MKLLWLVSLLLFAILLAEVTTAQRRFKKCKKFKFKNGRVTLISGGRLAKLKCKKGFNLFGGDKFLHCVERKWIGIKPICIGQTVPNANKRCSKFDLENGKVELKFHGQLRSVSCKEGYNMNDEDQFLSCVSQQWDGIQPKCIRRFEKCRELHLKNGTVRFLSGGRLAKLSCKKGYKFFGGDKFFHCVGKMWIGIKPMCIGITLPNEFKNCPKLDFENGKVKRKFRGQIAVLSCNSGYTMTDGDQFLTCVSQKWNGTLPMCIQSPSPIAHTLTLSKSTSTPGKVSSSRSVPTTTPAWEDNPIRDPECQPVKHLVDLCLPNEVGYSYSVTHKFISLCKGYRKKGACIPTVEKEKHWNVNKVQKGESNELLKISYSDHAVCKYEKPSCSEQTNSEVKKICQAFSQTHFWNEKTCECQCFVRINDEDICPNTKHLFSELKKINDAESINNESLELLGRGGFGGLDLNATDYTEWIYADYDYDYETDYDVIDDNNQDDFDLGGFDEGNGGFNMTCSMGDIFLEVGATLKMNEDSNCDIICSCIVPPELTCDEQSKCDQAQKESVPIIFEWHEGLISPIVTDQLPPASAKLRSNPIKKTLVTTLKPTAVPIIFGWHEDLISPVDAGSTNRKAFHKPHTKIP